MCDNHYSITSMYDSVSESRDHEVHKGSAILFEQILSVTNFSLVLQ